jgi:hypothetical protein
MVVTAKMLEQMIFARETSIAAVFLAVVTLEAFRFVTMYVHVT